MSQKSVTDMGKRMRFRENFIKYFSFSTIVILIIFFYSRHQMFLGPANLRTLLSDSAPLIIMAAGMTLVLLLGSIDLSMGAVCSVANVITVQILNGLGAQLGSPALGSVMALLVAVAFGAFAGLTLGCVHVKLKVPSFIASLGFMSLWQSVAYLITPAPVSVAKVMWGGVDWNKITFGVVGLPLILALGWVLVLYVFQSRTSFGRGLLAIGGNERASRIAGIPVDRTKIIVFMITGICAAIGGYFLAAKLRSSAPTVGVPFTLLIVASVALGGTALSGGRGSVLGTVLGVFTVSIIRNGLNFMRVDAYWQDIVFGIFVLGAVTISVDRSIRGVVIK
ncbi:MAG: ABC transporter permease [Clostridia bacterium]|nr:ABC transporter permease [Clostridia bacterium]